ncbi:hypothetical protein Dimus_000872, partial [Dionaea muscipula]
DPGEGRRWQWWSEMNCVDVDLEGGQADGLLTQGVADRWWLVASDAARRSGGGSGSPPRGCCVLLQWWAGRRLRAEVDGEGWTAWL